MQIFLTLVAASLSAVHSAPNDAFKRAELSEQLDVLKGTLKTRQAANEALGKQIDKLIADEKESFASISIIENEIKFLGEQLNRLLPEL